MFVDGCFWHGCSDHGTLPRNNREWWSSKLAGNRERDGRKDSELLELGWLPVHVWEHEDVEVTTARLVGLWSDRTGRSGPSR